MIRNFRTDAFAAAGVILWQKGMTAGGINSGITYQIMEYI